MENPAEDLLARVGRFAAGADLPQLPYRGTELRPPSVYTKNPITLTLCKVFPNLHRAYVDDEFIYSTLLRIVA